ncbi:MAG: hypothetical protein H0U32_00315 [Thermoleophilaceae bacterium]|nr:hypothetical protein [Thermoleophilaceae bacterium]
MESDVAAIGPVVERLADDVRIERELVEGVEVEYLVLSIGPRATASAT